MSSAAEIVLPDKGLKLSPPVVFERFPFRVFSSDPIYKPALRSRLHFSEQYLTFGHSVFHFLRQLKGFLQVSQTFDGRFVLFILLSGPFSKTALFIRMECYNNTKKLN